MDLFKLVFESGNVYSLCVTSDIANEWPCTLGGGAKNYDVEVEAATKALLMMEKLIFLRIVDLYMVRCATSVEC